MDNRETTAFEYTGVGCSVPKYITSVRFNDGLQKIGTSTFIDCTSLESITLPSTLVEISKHAFKSCCNLREVIFKEGIQKIGIGAFQFCSSLESIKLPSTVVEICNYAFQSCCNLREVILTSSHYHPLWLRLVIMHFIVAAI